MFQGRSPPKYKKLSVGGSATAKSLSSSTAASANAGSLNFTKSSSRSPLQLGSRASLLTNSSAENSTPECSHHHGHHQHHHGGSGRNQSSSATRRSKKHTWAAKERTGMSFLIVIAFFAIFGIIILTEIFMIDERTHPASLRHGNSYSGRMFDSMPDYDNVRDDYDLLEDKLLSDNRLGFVEFRDNKLKIQDAGDSAGGRMAGILLNSNGLGAGGPGMGVGQGGAIPVIPWGKVLPANIENSLPHFPQGTQPTDGSWQIVNGTRFKFFVFSAYYDRRDGAKLVRVVGATRTRAPERVWCRFWYAKGNASSSSSSNKYSSATVMARVKTIRENWNLKYSACFVLCPVRVPDMEVPQYVSIVSRLRAPPGNILQLRNTNWDPDFQAITNSSGARLAGFSTLPSEEQIPNKIGVCVKPFHFTYDAALYLIEYLEFNSILGVSHFTFYNHTLGPHVDCVLQHYKLGDIPDDMSAYDETSVPYVNDKPSNLTIRHNTNYIKPSINILPWNLRMRSQKEIRTEGLFAALNDCLYRNMYRYRYLALVDLDEFIVPRHNDTLHDLLNFLNQRFRTRGTGAYSFQNAFYYLQFPDDPLSASPLQRASRDSETDTRIRASLITQRKTKRRFKLHPQKQRSKYICKPEAVVEAGNHFVWEFAPLKGTLNVPPTDAILQHYRVCEFGGNDCIKAPATIDRSATRYAHRLVERVQAVYKHLRHRCELPELPPVSIEASKNNEEEQQQEPLNEPQQANHQQATSKQEKMNNLQQTNLLQTNNLQQTNNQLHDNKTKSHSNATAAASAAVVAATKTTTTTTTTTTASGLLNKPPPVERSRRPATTTTTTPKPSQKFKKALNQYLAKVSTDRSKAATSNCNKTGDCPQYVTERSKKVFFYQNENGQMMARLAYV